MNAYTQGRRAGHLMLAPSLNPFAENSAEAANWERGWRSATCDRLLEIDAARRQRNGSLAAEACSGIDEVSYP